MSEIKCATFTETRLLRAAAWLAKRSVVPCLCFARNGDRLHVMGTTGYVMIEGDVDAEFVGWEDGHGVALRDFKPMRWLVQVLKRSDGASCSVELREGMATVTVDGTDVAYRAFDVTYRAFFTSLEAPPKLVSDVPDEPEGSALMGVCNLDEAVAAMGKLDPVAAAWRVVPHGRNTALVFVLEDAPMSKCHGVRVMAMPRRED